MSPSKLTLHSPKSEAAESAAQQLAEMEARLEHAQREALAGRMTGRDLAAYQDEVDLARLRANRTREDAAAELSGLAKDKTISEQLSEMLADPALTTDALAAAFDALNDALKTIESVNAARNASISAWVSKLRSLGLPDHGLTVGDDELSIYSSAIGGTQIVIGGSSIQALRDVAPLIAHATHPYTRGAQAQNPESALRRLDKRAETTPRIRVRLSQALGGKPAGSILTNRETTATVLARHVRDGRAELIDGTLPTLAEEPARTHMPVGSDPTPSDGALTPGERLQHARDSDLVAAAVGKVFQ